MIYVWTDRVQEDTDTDDSSLSLEEPNDPNANSAGAEGAFAVEFNNKVHIASAEIEIGDESEIVSIDTPTHPQPVSELFLQANCPSRNILHPEYVSSFISVSEEIVNSSRSKLTEHEMALLQQYQQSELVSIRNLFDENFNSDKHSNKWWSRQTAMFVFLLQK